MRTKFRDTLLTLPNLWAFANMQNHCNSTKSSRNAPAKWYQSEIGTGCSPIARWVNGDHQSK